MIPKALLSTLNDTFTNYVILKVAVNPDKPDLYEHYKTHIEKHNRAIFSDVFPNSGFDLFVPETVEVESLNTTMISADIKCEMLSGDNSCGFYIFPRSSISKTPLMLANHTGIIDAGYRGFLIGAFRNLFAQPYTVEKHTRLLQVCHPSLCPVYAILVKDSDLTTTTRGEGGFGSTGI